MYRASGSLVGLHFRLSSCITLGRSFRFCLGFLFTPFHRLTCVVLSRPALPAFSTYRLTFLHPPTFHCVSLRSLSFIHFPASTYPSLQSFPAFHPASTYPFWFISGFLYSPTALARMYTLSCLSRFWACVFFVLGRIGFMSFLFRGFGFAAFISLLCPFQHSRLKIQFIRTFASLAGWVFRRYR